MPVHRQTALRERFVQLTKKARTLSPIEKLQIEVELSGVVDELLKSLPLKPLKLRALAVLP
jgi:hypothetical protein